MKIALIVLLIVMALISLLLILPIRIFLDYKKNESTNEMSLALRYGFLKFKLLGDKKDKPEKPKKEKEPESFDEKREKVSKYIKIFEETKDDGAEILDYMVSRSIVIERIYTDIEFGFEDAMHTGIFTGVLNGFVYGVLGFIHHHSDLRDMRVNIQPIFDNPCFKVKAGCIVRLKNVHIIIVAVKLLKMLKIIKNIERSK